MEEFGDEVIGKNWVYFERKHSTDGGGHLGERETPNMAE